MATYMSAVPAYGRDYKSQKEVRAAWAAGKDFLCMPGPGQSGGYVNKDDKPAGMVLNVRYKNQTLVCVIK